MKKTGPQLCVIGFGSLDEKEGPYGANVSLTSILFNIDAVWLLFKCSKTKTEYIYAVQILSISFILFTIISK